MSLVKITNHKGMKTYILILFIALASTSCAPVYVPNARNAPLFRGAGEFQGSVHFGQGMDAQMAVAITEHVGVMTNYNWVNRTGTSNESDYLKHNFFEGGIGYYENTGSICYEVFAGYGKGKGTSYGDYDFFGPTTVLSTGKYNRFFIQPSLGSNHKVFNWIFSTRFSVVDFTEFESDGQQPFNDTDPVIFIEPAFTGRINFGSTKMYAQFQTGLSWLTNGSTFFDYEPFHVSIGMGLRLGGLKQEK